MNLFGQFINDRVARYPAVSALLAVLALSLIAYFNSLPNSFHFDDIQGIVRNAALRNLENIPAYFTDIRISSLAGGRDWRPVLQITYALNYAIAGYDPMVFRITNLLIHVGAAWLIFLIVTEILKTRRNELGAESSIPPASLAAIASALFAVHTVNSEAVNYISSRSSVLAAFFYLLAFYCFLRGPFSREKQKDEGWWHLAGLGVFILGLATKATVVTLPAVLILYEILFLDHPSQNPLKLFWIKPGRLAKYFPVAAVCAAYIVLRFIFLRGFFRRVLVTSAEVNAPSYLLTQFRAWIYYIRLFLWPEPLITDYYGFGWSRSLWEGGVLLSLSLIVLILVFTWRMRRTEPLLTLFILWFFIALLPEASFIPLFDAVTGYRAYLANAGLAVVATLLSLKAATWLRERIKPGEQAVDSPFWMGYRITVVAILCVLIGATIVRNRAWRDELTLWTDVVEKDPANSRAYTNLALLYIEKTDYRKAQQMVEHAFRLGPKYYTYTVRGYLNFLFEKNDEAVSDLSRAIELNSRLPTPFYYRGEVYRKMHRYDDALADYQSALALLSFYTDAYLGIALVQMDKGETEKASESCAKITRIDPYDARGYSCLGILSMEQNRVADAIRIYQRGVLRVPGNGGLWYGLGLAYQQNGMYREAADAFERAGLLTR
jgi:protein O-mannosyl-transferase